MDPYGNPQSPHVFHILLALRAGKSHGYAIIREVERATDGLLVLSTGTLYSSLRRLLEFAWIEEAGPDPDDDRRRTYRLTGAGRRILQAERLRLEMMLGASNSARTGQG